MNYELRIVVTGIGFAALDGDDARTIALDVITDRATSGPAPMPRVVEVMGVGSDVRVRVSVDAADLTAAAGGGPGPRRHSLRPASRG
jgi:hypothetical protein